jgi:hypothetical protein
MGMAVDRADALAVDDDLAPVRRRLRRGTGQETAFDKDETGQRGSGAAEEFPTGAHGSPPSMRGFGQAYRRLREFVHAAAQSL